MTKDIIPGPGADLLSQSAPFESSVLPHISSPASEPGEVADESGDLWLDAIGDRLIHGKMAVTPEQAQAAARYGWEKIPGSEHEGKVIVRRPDPNPGQE